jgi:hypothetical protein
MSTHLGGVGSCQGLKDTPGDTAKDLTGDEHTKRIGENHDKDETSQGNDGNLHDDLGAVSISRPSVELRVR